MYRSLIVSIVLILANVLNAQSDFFGYGFKAGMSLSKFDGPSEIDFFGNELETYKLSSGFHIGMTLNMKFTDIMGLRAEVLYSQRGTKYEFEGPSRFVLGRYTLQNVNLTGTRRQTMKVSNSYIDVPLLAYFKIKYFEISAGLNTGILIGSAGGGNVEFSAISPTGNNVMPFEVRLNHNYKTDEAQVASAAIQDVSVDGRIYQVPEFTGAYYEFPERGKDLYKTFDLGLTAGLAYFLNDGLYIGARYIHGLGDIDRNEYDVALATHTANGDPVYRTDINKSRSWQISVGFTF
jgi:hypothetical protein